MTQKEFYDYCFINDEILAQIAGEAFYLHDIDVNQKYDDNKAYSYHLRSVASFVYENAYLVMDDEDDILPIMFGAYFHDSIEDARLTYNDVMSIALKYMDNKQAVIATEIVYALTNEKGRNRSERANDKYYECIRNTKYAPFVKMCDRLANHSYSYKKESSMCKKYASESKHFVDSIKNTKCSKAYGIPDSLINIENSLNDGTYDSKNY